MYKHNTFYKLVTNTKITYMLEDSTLKTYLVNFSKVSFPTI